MNGTSDSSLERFREEVIEKLSAGYSRDYLNEVEFEHRVEEATAAESHEQLRKLLMDLPIAGASDAPAVRGASAGTSPREPGYLVNESNVRSESSVVAIFSGADRKGVWDPPRKLNVIAMFGGGKIDLRDARIPAGGMTISAVVFFGGVEVIVPDDLNVEVAGAGIFGAFDGKSHHGSDDPRTPTITVDGVAFFGGVDIKIRRR